MSGEGDGEFIGFEGELSGELPKTPERRKAEKLAQNPDAGKYIKSYEEDYRIYEVRSREQMLADRLLDANYRLQTTLMGDLNDHLSPKEGGGKQHIKQKLGYPGGWDTYFRTFNNLRVTVVESGGFLSESNRYFMGVTDLQKGAQYFRDEVLQDLGGVVMMEQSEYSKVVGSAVKQFVVQVSSGVETKYGLEFNDRKQNELERKLISLVRTKAVKAQVLQLIDTRAQHITFADLLPQTDQEGGENEISTHVQAAVKEALLVAARGRFGRSDKSKNFDAEAADNFLAGQLLVQLPDGQAALDRLQTDNSKEARILRLEANAFCRAGDIIRDIKESDYLQYRSMYHQFRNARNIADKLEMDPVAREYVETQIRLKEVETKLGAIEGIERNRGALSFISDTTNKRRYQHLNVDPLPVLKQVNAIASKVEGDDQLKYDVLGLRDYLGNLLMPDQYEENVSGRLDHDIGINREPQIALPKDLSHEQLVGWLSEQEHQIRYMIELASRLDSNMPISQMSQYIDNSQELVNMLPGMLQSIEEMRKYVEGKGRGD